MIARGPLQGANVLHAAAALGHQDAVLLLLESRCELEGRIKGGFFSPLRGATAVTAASVLGFDDVAELLVNLRADVDASMKGWLLQGVSPLLAAAVSGHTETIQTLVKCQANLEAKVSGGILKGCTPLLAAAFAGRAAATKALLDCGANTEAQLAACFSARGATALFAAVIRRRFSDTVRVLVEARANTEAQLKCCWLPSGAKPLHAAVVFFSGQGTFRALLEAGCDVEARVTWVCANARPMHAAALVGNSRAALMLRRRGARLYSPVVPLFLPLPLPPILVATFSGIACIIISIIVGLISLDPEMDFGEILLDHFPWTVVGPLLAVLFVIDLPRLPTLARIGSLHFQGLRKARVAE